jgi:hypothetical protein
MVATLRTTTPAASLSEMETIHSGEPFHSQRRVAAAFRIDAAEDPGRPVHGV